MVHFGLKYIDYEVGEDLALWIEFMRHGARFFNIKQPLVQYRLHDQNFGLLVKTSLPRIQLPLAQELFPALTQAEATALLRLFPGGRSTTITSKEANETLQACVKALSETQTVFGEDRTVLSHIIATRFKALKTSVDHSGR